MMTTTTTKKGGVIFTKTREWENSISNSCSCQDFNENTQEFSPSVDCYGDCWQDTISQFAEEAKSLLDISESWVISGLPLWNRDVNGTAKIKNAEELLRALTVQGEWNLRFNIHPTRIVCHLSHHDVPMGRTFFAYPVLLDEGDDD